jgi:hypothetical protein
MMHIASGEMGSTAIDQYRMTAKGNPSKVGLNSL